MTQEQPVKKVQEKRTVGEYREVLFVFISDHGK